MVFFFFASLVGRGGAQDAVDDVRRGDPLGSLDHPEPARALRGVVRVRAVREQARVIAVHDEVDAVLRVERLAKLRRQVVRHVLDDLIHPLHGGDHRASLRLPQHRGALASKNLRVRNQTHHQRVAARLRLPQRVGVSEVREVEAPVHVHADRLPLRASGPKRASGGLQQSGDATGCGDHGACGDRRHRRERRGETQLTPSRPRHRAPSCGARPHRASRRFR